LLKLPGSTNSCIGCPNAELDEVKENCAEEQPGKCRFGTWHPYLRPEFNRHFTLPLPWFNRERRNPGERTIPKTNYCDFGEK
jgi:hypothetical protein